MLTDEYGDGLNGAAWTQCGVDGNYSAVDSSGTVLFQIGDPNYGSEIQHTFCLTAVFGCTNADACNFDVEANTDNGTCVLPGDECDDEERTTTTSPAVTSPPQHHHAGLSRWPSMLGGAGMSIRSLLLLGGRRPSTASEQAGDAAIGGDEDVVVEACTTTTGFLFNGARREKEAVVGDVTGGGGGDNDDTGVGVVVDEEMEEEGVEVQGGGGEIAPRALERERSGNEKTSLRANRSREM